MHSSCTSPSFTQKCKGLLKWTLLAVSAFFLAPSCNKVDVDFGGQYVNTEHTEIIKLDTITPLVSTVYVDSFSTAAPSSALVGANTDQVFGKITASNYFEVTAPTNVTPPTDATFDSLVLVLKPDKSWYGDTTTAVHLNVYELDELMEPVLTTDYATTGTFYNTTSFAKKSTVLGSTTVTVRPNQTDSVVIKLSGTNLGDTLLALLKNGDDALSTSEKFRNYVLKGLYVNSATTDKLILGFKDSVDLRLYYTSGDAVREQTYTSFPVSNTAHQFNHVDIDRSGTALGNAGFNGTTKAEILSTSLNNMAYMQYITGSVIKIRFPTLRVALTNAPNYSSILRADLVIKPVLGTYDYPYALPSSLRLSTTDKENKLGSDLVYSSTSSASTQTGSLSYDPTNLKNTQYSYDMTAYLKSLILVTELDNEDGVLLLPPSTTYTTAFDRLVVGDNANVNGQMSLVIYYMAIK